MAAATGAEIGVAYVSLTVSAKGIAQDIRRELAPVDTEAAKSGKSAGSKFASGIKDQIKDIGKTIAAAFAVQKVVSFFKESVAAASELEQAGGAVDAVFGKNADTIHAFGKTAAQSVGMATSEYEQMAATFGASLSNMGVAADDLIPTTNGLIELGADLAAQYNGSTSEAVSAIGALFRGQADPIERFGVTITANMIKTKKAEMGLAGLSGEADRAATTQARLALLTEQTGSAVGAFAREADTYAGKQKRLNAEWVNMQAAVGGAIMPVAQAVLSLGAMAIPVLETVGTAVGGLIASFVDLPGPVLAAAAALAAVALLKGPLGNAFLFIKGEVLAAKLQMQSLQLQAQASGGSMGKFAAATKIAGAGVKGAASGMLSAMGGPWGLAIAAGVGLITVAIQNFQQRAANSKAQADSTADTIKAIGDAAKQSGGYLNEFTRSAALDKLQDKKWGNKKEGFAGFLESAGIATKDLIDDMVGVAGASEKVTAAYNLEREALLQKIAAEPRDRRQNLKDDLTDLDAQWQAYQEIADSAEQAAAEQEKSAAATDASASAQEIAAQAFERGADGALDLADAQKEQADATKLTITENTALARALAGVGQETKAAKTELDGFKYILDEISGRNRTAEQAAVNWNKAVRDATDAVKDQGKATGDTRQALADWNVAALTGSETGQKYYDTVDKLADAYADQVAAAYSAKAATGDVAGAQADARTKANELHAQFVSLARSMGLSQEEAEALARKLGVVNDTDLDDKTLEIIADAGQAERVLANVSVATVDGKTVYIDGDTGKYYGSIADLQAARVQKDVDVDANIDPAIGEIKDWTPPAPAGDVPLTGDITGLAADVSSITAGALGGWLKPIPTEADTSGAQQDVNSITPQPVKVTVTADLGQANAAVGAWTPLQRVVKIGADISPAVASNNAWTPQQRTVKITADLAPANSSNNAWTPMQRTVKIGADISPAIQVNNAWTPLQRVVKIDGDISPAVGVINRWSPAAKTVSINADTGPADRSMAAFMSRNTTKTVTIQTVGGGDQGGAPTDIRGYMAGGATPNYGPSNRDTIDIRVHRGEHIFDAGDVAAMGGQAAVYAFRRALHQGSAPAAAAAAGRPVTVVLRVDGDSDLADLVRRNATVVVEQLDSIRAREMVGAR